MARALARHPDRFDLRLFEAESRFSYSVRYRGGLCAHGFDSDIRRRIYDELSAGFRDRINLDRPARKVHRRASGVVVEDEDGRTEAFDDVVFACNANQTLMILDNPTLLVGWLLSAIRCESELHNHTVVHSDAEDRETRAKLPYRASP